MERSLSVNPENAEELMPMLKKLGLVDANLQDKIFGDPEFARSDLADLHKFLVVAGDICLSQSDTLFKEGQSAGFNKFMLSRV